MPLPQGFPQGFQPNEAPPNIPPLEKLVAEAPNDVLIELKKLALRELQKRCAEFYKQLVIDNGINETEELQIRASLARKRAEKASEKSQGLTFSVNVAKNNSSDIIRPGVCDDMTKVLLDFTNYLS